MNSRKRRRESPTENDVERGEIALFEVADVEKKSSPVNQRFSLSNIKFVALIGILTVIFIGFGGFTIVVYNSHGEEKLSDFEIEKIRLSRGVAPPLLHLYVSSDEQFTCLKSNETILRSRINDDYCDCADGSDEPGTNACPKSLFYCKHNEQKIPSSQVNDGICGMSSLQYTLLYNHKNRSSSFVFFKIAVMVLMNGFSEIVQINAKNNSHHDFFK